MSLLSYHELCWLAENDIIEGVKPEAINGTSIDVHLGSTILKEDMQFVRSVSLRDKQALAMNEVNTAGKSYMLLPGEFILAHTVEKFNLPDNISAEFKLNSSGARIGLENALATWCDPHWHGSVLTLELKNFTRSHIIELHDGCRIGQMIFYRSEPVPREKGYAVRGRYNQDTSVSGVKEK